MIRPFLLGPLHPGWPEQHISRLLREGLVLPLYASPESQGGISLSSLSSWADLERKLPAGWRPSFLALSLDWPGLPEFLWDAPLPKVGLAAGWDLSWHHYRHQLGRCHRIVTDAAGAAMMHRHGLTQARVGGPFGLEPALAQQPLPQKPRDIDLLVAGTLHPDRDRAQLPLLQRAARLAAGRNVLIHFGDGPELLPLLQRARLVLPCGSHGQGHLLALRALAAGALVLLSPELHHLLDQFAGGAECVSCADAHLEDAVGRVLEQEEQRQKRVDQARARLPGLTTEALWLQVLQQIDQEWDSFGSLPQTPRPEERQRLQQRGWQVVSHGGQGDPTLVRDLASALAANPLDATLHSLLGVIVTARAAGGQGPAESAVAAVEHFRRAVAQDPGHGVAGLNLVEALLQLGHKDQAAQQARLTLDALERLPSLPLDQLEACPFPPSIDLFRVEWERAAWASSTAREEASAKHRLLRWRLHLLLGHLTGEIQHHYETVLLRPDLPVGQAALGCALGRLGKPALALNHLRQAVQADPLDRPAARGLFSALGEVGDSLGQHRLARDLFLLHRAAPQLGPAEEWFSTPALSGHGLASVVVLCCNEAGLTRQCLDSVLRHTDTAFELILVDNGSTDQTPHLLEEIQAQAGSCPLLSRVQLLRNETNRGYPAGCNQALAQARGDFLVFLNNDTVVTSGWLSRLIGWALSNGPHVGLVGPTTSYAPAPQLVPVDYQSVEGIQPFAQRQRLEQQGKALKVERLSGFCLLVRREVFDKVGTFDEQFGLGFFDDDDLCLRARKQGFQLLVALDVFVHHFGSRTFQGLGIDCSDQLKQNLDRFRAKWGDEQAGRYRLLDAAPPSPPEAVQAPVVVSAVASALPRVSLCIIARNEEKNLPHCLGSAADLADDVVVVDTGSTDRTKEIAQGFGARVFDFPWQDSFALARNESLRHARGEWIFWLDADDRLDEDNRRLLRQLFSQLPPANVGYVMKCLCLPDQEGGGATVVDHIRLFRNDPRIRWRYRVHEQILMAIRESGGQIHWSDVVVHHTGYQDPARRGPKLDRDLRLLLLEQAEHPDEPFVLFNLGWTEYELGRCEEALSLLRRSLERSKPGDSIVRKIYALMLQCYGRLGRGKEALAVCREGQQVCPEDAELLYEEGRLLLDQGQLSAAEACFVRLVKERPQQYFASVDPALRGYRPRHYLGVICYQQKRQAEAEEHWRQVLAQRPDYIPSLLGLTEIYLEQGRWADLEGVREHLGRLPPSRMEAEVVRARGLLARQDYPGSLAVLEAVCREHPQAVWPRLIRSHALLQQGKDLPAAEQALRDVLALDPDNPQARHNLRLVLQQRGVG